MPNGTQTQCSALWRLLIYHCTSKWWDWQRHISGIVAKLMLLKSPGLWDILLYSMFVLCNKLCPTPVLIIYASRHPLSLIWGSDQPPICLLPAASCDRKILSSCCQCRSYSAEFLAGCDLWRPSQWQRERAKDFSLAKTGGEGNSLCFLSVPRMTSVTF